MARHCLQIVAREAVLRKPPKESAGPHMTQVSSRCSVAPAERDWDIQH